MIIMKVIKQFYTSIKWTIFYKCVYEQDFDILCNIFLEMSKYTVLKDRQAFGSLMNTIHTTLLVCQCYLTVSGYENCDIVKHYM
ncbi:hypothetical protein NQ317_011129 [Molorchus minor]|uniref:Uncharacterized protein n=1 Tax=Molorchus minor TaxID=1323400 RepID=A0ABQ9K2Z9_9CUCU|nr:hypothetical protein NQ317_011129 [Molorchus minor]